MVVTLGCRCLFPSSTGQKTVEFRHRFQSHLLCCIPSNSSIAPMHQTIMVCHIAQMRKTATNLQRQADLDRPRTREELKTNNCWLDWDEVLAACKLQRARFEVARGTRQGAREAADLLLISLYCHIPPSRGLEMRTLEIVQERDTIFPFHSS